MIDATVCRILKPKKKKDYLSAHQVILDLAKTDDGQTRVVTTNFDRLFSEVNPTLRIFTPGSFPDINANPDFDGLIHLHGIANRKYDTPDGEGLILSSSSFGRAYLSEGWATKFIVNLIDNFTVVFIGYGASDPPVSYLLEALGKYSLLCNHIYAFQSGDDISATGKWAHKGVQAIPYIESDRHSVLWDTLKAWAAKVKDKSRWESTVLTLAHQSPDKLKPFERGQVAHLVSSKEGMKAFASTIPTPPSSWLCVFTPWTRYNNKKDTENDWFNKPKKDDVDLFANYALDSDIPPPAVPGKSNDEVALSAWNFFRFNETDEIEIDASLTTGLVSEKSSYGSIPPRVFLFRGWFEKLLNEPCTLWWACKQPGIHPRILRFVDFIKAHPDSLKIWNVLLEEWKQRDDPHNHLELQIEHESDKIADLIRKHKKNMSLFATFFRLNHPYAFVTPKIGLREILNCRTKNMSEWFNVTVRFPNHYEKLSFFNKKYTFFFLKEVRRHIDWVLQVEPYKEYSLHPFNDSLKKSHIRDSDFNYLLHYYTSLFETAITCDINAAKSEYYSWPKNGVRIWDCLRIWAAKFIQLQPLDNIVASLLEVNDDDFWEYNNRRDLTITLKTIWGYLNNKQKQAIEYRLLHGHPKLPKEHQETDFVKYAGYLVLKECSLSKTTQKRYEKLREKHHYLSERYIRNLNGAIEPIVTGGFVQYVTDFSFLNNVPIRNIVSECIKHSEKKTHFLKENKPFIGLVQHRPIRAFHALTYHARKHIFDRDLWSTFFYNICKKNDAINAKRFYLCHIIISRLLQYHNLNLKDIMPSMSSWFEKISAGLSEHYPETYDAFMDKLVSINKEYPKTARTNITSPADISVLEKALNSPTGRIVGAWFKDVRYDKNNTKLPKQKTDGLTELLGCVGEVRDYSLSMLSHNLPWLYLKAETWVKHNILCFFKNGNKRESIIILEGMKGATDYPQPRLFYSLKNELIDVLCTAKEIRDRDRYWNLLLYGWFIDKKISGNQLVSNKEFHDIIQRVNDDNRRILLWTIGHYFRRAKQHTREEYTRFGEFFNDVWPKQKAVNTTNTTDQIMGIMMSDVELFPRIYHATRHCLGTIGSSIMLTNIDAAVLEKHHLEIFRLLHKLLPHDIKSWPYKFEKVLRALGAYAGVAKIKEYQRIMKILEQKKEW
ncbi:MAG: SIR2 family protein [Planctomycetaceae bacterium]|nr:SIR2 family protein [Planctomycetaceae bacterium]